ncbi:MAG TPA: hypothetical protein VF860_05620, partial [Candidatus Acidoferrales bacterium]
RLRSIQVAGARSAAGSALPGRFATGVAANHAVARRSKSSAQALRPRSGDVGNRMIGERQARVRGPARECSRVRDQAARRRFTGEVGSIL